MSNCLWHAAKGLGRVSQTSIFDSETPLPDDGLARREKTLLGFDARYARVHDQLRLLLNVGQLGELEQASTMAASSRFAIWSPSNIRW